MVLQLCCYSKNKNRRKTTYQFEVSYKNDTGNTQDYLEPLPVSSANPNRVVTEENDWEFSNVRVRHSRSLEDTVSKSNPRTPSFLKYKYRKLQELDNTVSDLDGSSSNLKNYLGKRLQKADDQRLPRTFSDNVYQNVTTGISETPRRVKNGRDYVFVSVHEFRESERKGNLRHKYYEENYYGIPRTARGFSEPLSTDYRPKPAKRTNVGRIGQMDMMSKQSMVDHLDEHQNQQPNHDDTLSSRSRSPGEAPSYRHDSSHLQPTEEELGPLPTNWEKAYTERGEVYFIDHNSGTSQWLDPRLARLQKKSLEECSDDELPYGWEKIDDPHYGVYYIDHVNRKTQYENPVLQAKRLAMNNNGGGSISDSGSSTFPRAKKSQMEMPPGMTEQPVDQTQPKRAASDSTLKRNKKARDNYQRSFFTRNPSELQGEKIVTRLVKSTRGLGFTIVGGDDSDDEFLQIKSVVPNGPAWLDGNLRTGDVIVYVNDVCVLGFTHHDMVSMFQRISPGEAVTLEVCRGYPLSFDLNDPNTEIVTTVAVSADPYAEEQQSHNQPRPVSALRDEAHMGWSENGRVSKSVPEMMGKQESRSRPNSRPGSADILHGQEPEEDLNVSTGSTQPIEYLTVRINKGDLGFGFTIADSANGQKVKKILDRPRCKNLQESDILIDINGIDMRALSHSEVVQLLKDCPKGQDATITVQRGGVNSPRKNKWKKSKDDTNLGKKPLFSFAGLYRSKTPTADLYSAQTKEVVPTRPKTPLVDTRQRSKTPNEYENRTSVPRELARTPVADLANQFSNVHLDEDPYSRTKQRSKSPGRELDYQNGYDEYNQRARPPPPPKPLNARQYQPEPVYYQQEYYEDDIGPGQLVRQDSGYGTQFGSSGYYGGPTGYQTEWRQEQQLDRRDNYPGDYPPHQLSQPPQRNGVQTPSDWVEMTVTLLRQESGFGFRIVGGTEEGSQVSIGHIVPGGSADMDGRLRTGDEILNVDGINVVHSSHHHVVQLMGAAASRGRVTIGVRRRMDQPIDAKNEMVTYPYDVTVTRRETEGFGFVIISSVTKAVSFIGQIIRGSPAERCERLHVGDRILAVNHVNIEHLNHGDIVSLIKDSGYSVTLTVGPPIDDTSSNTTAASQQSSQGSMVMAQAVPTIPGEMPQQHLAYDQGYAMNEMGPPYGKRDMVPPSGQYLEDSVDGRTIDSDISSYFTVELQRGPRGFGFSIRGGREFHSMPLFVLRIADHGPAAEDGRLQVGDQLIEINGINTSDMAHSEAIEVIKSGGPTVRLLVRRGTKMPPGIADMEPLTQLSPIVPGSNNITGYSDGRPGSSMSQPHLAPAYSTPNESTQSYQHWQNSHGQNGPVHIHQQSHVAPSTNQYVPLRPGAPPPLLVQPSGRHYPMQNGPLSHSSPRITTATDYYWERYPEVRQ